MTKKIYRKEAARLTGTATLDWRRGPGRAPMREGSVAFELLFEVLTPVLGGGAKPETGDPITPLRGKAVRGHLRFWWRAIYNTYHGSLRELRDAENAVFGGPKTAALPEGEKTPPWLRITISKTTAVPYSFRDNGRAYLAGQAFDKGDKKAGTVISGSIRLRLEVAAQYEDQVRNACVAWLAFGGLGARTSRGFGACRLSTPAEDIQETFDKLKAIAKKGQGPLKGIPSFFQAELSVGGGFDDTVAAHSALGREYKYFRLPSLDPKSPKKSPWPAAIALRNGNLPKDIPRLAFGAPIVFPLGNNKQHTANPINENRAASDLIMGVTKDGAEWCPFGLWLNTPGRDQWPHQVDCEPVTTDGSSLETGGKNALLIHLWPRGEGDGALRTIPAMLARINLIPRGTEQ